MQNHSTVFPNCQAFSPSVHIICLAKRCRLCYTDKNLPKGTTYAQKRPRNHRFSEILKIVDACEILRLGLADGNFPYIVPVNFAYTVKDKQLCFYIHGAMAGRKYELLCKNPFCSFEMDIPLGMECIPAKRDVTMRYKSVMGQASVTFLEGAEKERIMDTVLMACHAQTAHFDYNRAALARTAVAKLTVLSLTAKANLPGGGAD